MVRLHLCNDLCQLRVGGLGQGTVESCGATIARANLCARHAYTRTAIIYHCNAGAWNGTSMTAPAKTVACTDDKAVLDGLPRMLDSHVDRRGLDTLGCVSSLSNLQLAIHPTPISN